ncbi:MAG: tRNA (guanosine(46)-N7)-methyltransferase TrmB [Gammaproteobacteria bacterium]
MNGGREPGLRRTVRSFVMRGGRTTPAQKRALAELLPRFGIAFSAAPLDLDRVFGRRGRRIMEIGFGDGAQLVAQAAAEPAADFIGIEVHPPGIGRCLLGIELHRLPNVRVIAHDAIEVLAQQVPPASLDEIQLWFPDPWPKKRHHKRRIVQPAFAALVAGRLKSGGRLRLATDWEPYAECMLEVLNTEPLLVNVAAGGHYLESADRSTTRFESRGRRLGHRVFDLEYRRR